MTSDAQAGQPFRIELEGLTKIYPSVVANDKVSLAVRRGEIHAVLGENGAGKSTLMKMIYGVTRPDEGRIRWEGEEVEVRNPAHARSLGIGMVFQHFSLFETLNVVENVALALPGNPDLAELATRISEVSERYGLPVDPHRLVHALSVGARQRVEIIRCEIQELCHVATVLRDGKVTGDCVPAEETPKSMARLMIGKELPVPEHDAPAQLGEVRLRLAKLSRPADDPFGTDLDHIDLEVRSGEIVGIAGVSGNGQQELLYALSGEKPVDNALAIEICGIPAGRDLPGARRRKGLGFVPEERLGRGAVPRLSLTDNALLTAYHRDMLNKGMIRFERVAQFARDCIRDFNVKCGGATHAANSLSGGNLQKFIMGREILLAPKLLVVAQPTWGVDVGAAAFIRQRLIDLRDEGAAILVISEELEELFEISDRIAVIAGGRLSPTRLLKETNIDEIGLWMSGMWEPNEGTASAVAGGGHA